MKLRSIRLKDVRRFVAPVRVGPFVDGLNLLAEPNEHGKSTLFDALQAVFFAPATGRSQAVQSLQPHAGGAPEVWVDVEMRDGPVEIRKRWLQKPQAEIHRQGRLIAQADAAEAWLAAQLGPEREGGPAGLLWVRQGQAGWETGSKGAREDRLAVRRDLLSSVRGEVETMTGGRRMDAVRARCRADLDIYVTKTGRPLRAGPWQALLDRVAALESDKTDLERRVSQHRETLDARRRLRRELAEITDPEAEAARAAGLRAAENAARAAEAASERAAEAQRALTLAALQAETATAAARRWRDAMD
ncbi:MAG: chromosome segregation protein SMC, partial [Pseudomonadota bacterium]